MEKYFQRLIQMLKITYHVWFLQYAKNPNRPVTTFVAENGFKRKKGHKRFEALELEKKLISRIRIQKKAIFHFEIHGVSVPMFMN